MDHLCFCLKSALSFPLTDQRPHTFTWPASYSIISFLSLLNRSTNKQMLGFQLKKQTLISSFPTIAPILSVHFSAKLLKKLSIFTISIPPDCLPLRKPGTGHGQPLTYSTGTGHSLYPLSLAFGLQSQPRERVPVCHMTIKKLQFWDAIRFPEFFPHCLQGPHSSFSSFVFKYLSPPVLPCPKYLSATLSWRHRNPWGHGFHILAVPRQLVWMNETVGRSKSQIKKIDTGLRVGGAVGSSGTTVNCKGTVTVLSEGDSYWLVKANYCSTGLQGLMLPQILLFQEKS